MQVERTRDACDIDMTIDFWLSAPCPTARAVMERSENVPLIGEGAMAFLREQDLAWEDPAYFHTEQRWQALQTELERRRSAAADTRDDAARHGTVGAVACDAAGNLAAATSTGGHDRQGAGPGGRLPDRRRRHLGGQRDLRGFRHRAWRVFHSLGGGARDRFAHTLSRRGTGGGGGGGGGGLIAVDAAGNVALPFNSAGMYRGRIGADGVAWTGIYRAELRAA